MKRKLIKATLILGIIVVILQTSCDKDFEIMNVNPNAYTSPDLGMMFTYSLIEAAGGPGYTNNPLYYNCKVAGAYMQYFASLNTWQWTGDKYLKKPSYDDALYSGTYAQQIKEVTQSIFITKDNPEQVNHHAINRIWRVYIFHRVTDFYGDVPYSEAGKGYLEKTFKPKFDKQSDIYADMLKELEEAALQLDPDKPSFGPSDLVYNGDPNKWKKLAYSLMLRLGMRLTKVDPAMAETWVKKAIAGGVMSSNADNAFLRHSMGTLMNVYSEGSELTAGEGVPPSAKGNGYGKMSKTFVDHLKATNDPRGPFYITLWQGNADPSQMPTSTLLGSQKGLPNGYDASTIKSLYPSWVSTVDLPLISEINLNTVSNYSTPTVYLQYAEIELLLAEAVLRGWETGVVKTHYDNAVRGSMEIEAIYPGGIRVNPADIETYLVANPFLAGTFNEQMNQIHTQFWVSLFMNNLEVWSNYRRTGYPALIPTNYTSNETGGKIPRRVPYPSSEASTNTVNYNEAIQRQGADLFTTRVWWDKE